MPGKNWFRGLLLASAAGAVCVGVASPGTAETRTDTRAPRGAAFSQPIEAVQTADSIRTFAAQNLAKDDTAVKRPPTRPTPSAASIARAARCKDRGALGVSRTLTLDTSARNHFGQQQYKQEADILQPGEVVLTFDDGPLRRHTTRVLAALEKHCTKATFFVVGKMAIADPDMLRKVAAAGHTIGHHSWSHLNQNRHNFERTIAEFELGVSAVEAVIGRPSAPFFRFPYLADPKRMQSYLGQRNFGIFSIDIDSNDWRSKSASRVHSTIMRGLKSRGKGILLFHDIQSATASSLDSLLNDIKANGFKIVHLEAKTQAVALPEYDEEAAVLLEKRQYTRRARPLKTAFRYNGSVVEKDGASTRRPKPAVDRPQAQRTVRQAADRPQRYEPPQLRATPEPRPVVRPSTPAWRDSVFGSR